MIYTVGTRLGPTLVLLVLTWQLQKGYRIFWEM